MGARRLMISLGIAVVLLAGLPSTAAAAPGLIEAGTERVVPGISADRRAHMLTKVNELRSQAGVPPVRQCMPLNRSAQRYAREMARTENLSHVARDGRDPGDRVEATGYRARVVGENIGAGQRTVVRLMRQLRDSPRHYATIVDPRFTHVGFGYAPGDGSPFNTYWVQQFAAGGSCA